MLTRPRCVARSGFCWKSFSWLATYYYALVYNLSKDNNSFGLKFQAPCMMQVDFKLNLATARKEFEVSMTRVGNTAFLAFKAFA